jgi:hypothetical protein
MTHLFWSLPQPFSLFCRGWWHGDIKYGTCVFGVGVCIYVFFLFGACLNVVE